MKLIGVQRGRLAYDGRLMRWYLDFYSQIVKGQLAASEEGASSAVLSWFLGQATTE